MLTEKTNDVQTKAIEFDDQTSQDQNPMIQTENLLIKHYHILYKQYRALLERYPTRQKQYQDIDTFRKTLQDYCQSQQEHLRLIQQFRQMLLKHLRTRWNYRSDRNSQIQADRPLLRKTILLGAGNEKDAAFLKESMQQAGGYRVFLAADSNQVLCLVQSVHIDLLVLDDELIPLPGIELFHHLHRMKGLEATPAIIMSDCFSPLFQTELALNNLIGLEKPIELLALMKIIDQLLV